MYASRWFPEIPEVVMLPGVLYDDQLMSFYDIVNIEECLQMSIERFLTDTENFPLRS